MKDLFGKPVVPKSTLAGRFLIPPFSVLDARGGDWQRRKRQWIRLGIQGELGREAGLACGISCAGLSTRDTTWKGKTKEERDREKVASFKNQGALSAFQKNKKPAGQCFAIGSKALWDEQQKKRFGQLHNGSTIDTKSGDEWDGGRSAWQNAGTSVFDPVLCELIYRWFLPKDGRVLDPFAGEATKGIVATCLGYGYTGIELRQEQIDANNMQAKKIGVSPKWIQGSSVDLLDLISRDDVYDLIWTSPPYYDLEVYSEKEEDGSAFADYETFMQWYTDIFQKACRRLKTNRFAAVKVGEIRNKKTGAYRNFVGDNIKCFMQACGLHYYNEMILVTSVGSLPVRAGKQFASGRKIGKTHQNILVFYKGDLDKIPENFKGLL